MNAPQKDFIDSDTKQKMLNRSANAARRSY